MLIDIYKNLTETENKLMNYILLIFETRMWFLRPSRDISLLQQRQKAVSYFMNLRNSELVASLQDCLKHIKNVSVSMGMTHSNEKS